jgi:CheY-like chemotaxis protein
MKPKKILIVDDDPIVARVYTHRFRLDGYEAEAVGDGETAVEMLGKAPPDLVILDIELPGMNGVEVLKRIRSRPETAALPVIVLSNNYLPSMVQMVQDAWKAGATKCLAKIHCTPLQMAEVVRKTLEGKTQPAEPAPAEPAPAKPATPAAPALKIRIDRKPAAKSEVTFQIKLVGSFLANAPKTLATIRGHHLALARSEGPKAQLQELHELKSQTRLLADSAGLLGFHSIAQIASVLEALLAELHSHPEAITGSTIRTIAQAVDALAALVNRTGNPQAELLNSHLILVVDDEQESRANIFSALRKVGLRAVGLDKSSLALRVLDLNAVDLILLDMEMPEISGTEVCDRLRRTDINRATPVVFVAGNAEFENRTRSARSGGNDLIAKPFLPLELALKVLTWLRKNEGTPEPG